MTRSDKNNTLGRSSLPGPLAWLVGYQGIPYLARHPFRFEFVGVFTFAIAAAVMEGGFAQFFATKTLLANEWVLAAIVSAGALGNFTAALVTPLLLSKRQVPVMVLRMVLCGLLLGAVAVLPARQVSSYAFAGIFLLIAALNATAVNARTSIWQANYPDQVRGQIVSRFIMVNMALVMVLVKVHGWLLDNWPWSYRVLFAVGGVSAIVTAVIYNRIRMRGQEAWLRAAAARKISLNPLGLIDVLRNDRLFARYMLWQMVMGSATLAAEGVIVRLLKDRFDAGYGLATTALVVAPMLVNLLSTPLLGRWYDTWNIFIFRGCGAAFWGLGRFVVYAGGATGLMPLLVVGRGISGLGGSFGGLAWSLGHLNFATPARAPLYLGVHMLLTGIRGAVMPALGIWLYAHTVVGIHLIWITGVLHAIAAVGLWSMRKTLPTPA